MFAVIKTGGKQYRVAADDTITIERLAGEVGDAVTFGEVMMLGNGDDIQIGAPLLSGLTVTGEIVEQGRGEKVISFKKRRRQNSRRKRGHRQLLTTVRITEIAGDSDGARPAKAKAAKAKPAAEKAEADKPAAKAEADKPAAEKPAASGKSPLEQIKGIGPKAAAELGEEGIDTLEALAGLDDDRIADIDARMPFSAAQISDWREQAKALIG